MRASIRGLAAWAAMLSLLTGFLLPFGTEQAAVDADGICGPTLVLGQSSTSLEPAPPPVGQNHCAFCHWRHTMASASAAAFADFALPSDPHRAPASPLATDPDAVVTGVLVPRGPPAIS